MIRVLFTISSQLSRFFVYEEYGAKYELMIRDVAAMYRTMPQWEVYQKGFEALASSLASINNQHNNSKKALSIGDLLVKARFFHNSRFQPCTNIGSANSKGV
jgi:hypothetical protein